MKKYLFSIIALSALLLSSCEKESEGLTRTTYYPILTVLGDDVIMSVGDTFTDEGCEAILNGQDVSDQVVATTNLNTAIPGIYKVNYVITNEDGFSASASRVVYVVDDATHFANVYYGESQYGTRHYYDLPVTISDNGDGTYTISDILGGFYGLGRYPQYQGTSYDFFADAIIQLNGDNSISLISVGSWYFGQYPITITTGTFDPTTGTIDLLLDFDGDPFYVKLVVFTV